MLYDMEWLHEGAKFPPTSELERLSDYQDHKRMFDGEASVFESYSQRIQEIIEKFRSYGFTYNVKNMFCMDLNYFRLLSLKTKQLLMGDPPTISGKDDIQTEKIREMMRQSKFIKRLKQCIVDASRYGDGVCRIYKKEDGKGGLVIVSPEMWFPIVDRETNEIKQHCICWIEKEPHPYGRGKETFYVQIHDKGFYTLRVFSVKDQMMKSTITLNNGHGRTLEVLQCTLGREIEEKRARVNTGLKSSAIVLFQNFVPSDSVYGVSDYEDISCVIAELQIRYAIESLVLDKHSAPSMYGPDSALVRDSETGEWRLKSGTYFPTAPNEQPPGYLTWDASFQANHEMIVKLEKHLFALSQMGAVLNDDAFGASQGFEALEVRLTNAKSKARDIASDMTDSVIETISLISQIGYDAISPEDISIQWNEGLPTSEFREVNIATQKKGLFSRKTILKDHFGLTDEKAQEEVGEVEDEEARQLASGFGVGIGGGGNDKYNSDDDVDEEARNIINSRGDAK